MNTNLLRSKMVLNGETIKTLSEHLGIAYQTCSRKISGSIDFRQSEIIAIKNLYNLTDQEVVDMFVKDVTT